MSETKHTPGPWGMFRKVGRNMRWHIRAGGYDGTEIVSLTQAQEADACLIAAAPELYEALDSAVSALMIAAELHPGLKPALDKARAALAKARGERG